MRRVFAGLAAMLAAAVPVATMPAASSAGGEGMRSCAPRAAVIGRLASAYGETRRGIGLSSGGAVIEIFASSETGSWTITATFPDGTTCLVAAGEAFEGLEARPPRPGTRA